MLKKKPKNNYAFIDSNNLYRSIHKQGWKLDFSRFRKYLYDKYDVGKALLFIGYVPTNQSLYKSLQQEGYVVIFKPTLILPNGKPKGNTDAELVMHAMIEYQNYDKAVIVAGDGDYHCLVEYLTKQKKLLRLIIPDRYRYSSLLTKFSPDTVFLNDLQKKLEYKRRV